MIALSGIDAAGRRRSPATLRGEDGLVLLVHRHDQNVDALGRLQDPTRRLDAASPGMFRSITTTSGRHERTSSTASSPDVASPTTSMSATDSSSELRPPGSARFRTASRVNVRPGRAGPRPSCRSRRILRRSSSRSLTRRRRAACSSCESPTAWTAAATCGARSAIRRWSDASNLPRRRSSRGHDAVRARSYRAGGSTNPARAATSGTGMWCVRGARSSRR
jgi:hypothetical protein